MTTEEKAKAYDEAIERAKGLQHENAWVTTIFPELAMGEDEKIIQELIDYLNPDIPFKTASIDTVNRWIAYLEKQKGDEQKEQKPAEWSEEDEKMRNSIIEAIHNLWPYEHRDKCINWLKSLRA